MKKLIGSPWMIAILALVFGLGTQAGVFAWRLGWIGGHEKPETQPEGENVPDVLTWNFLTPEIERLSAELEARLEEIAVRESTLDDFALRLEAERAEIEKLRRDIETRRNELSSSLIEIQSVEQKNLKGLASSYSNLSPAAALAIFQEMDDETVVKILSYMKSDPVGQILEEMARTKDGEGTLAGRAAELTNMLRLLRQVKTEEAT